MREIQPLRAALLWIFCLLLSPLLASAGAPPPDAVGSEVARAEAAAAVAWLPYPAAGVRLHVLPATSAARDAPLLAAEAERSLARVRARLELSDAAPLDVYLVERVFWQGGAAYDGEAVLLAYLDRNYVDVPIATYLDHEFTHALAHALVAEGGRTNTLLAEGLATWATGGHYGPEPLHALAASLVGSEQYVPLPSLVSRFREAQHEIAYIEAASFVGWLVERYGLDTVKRFYGAADTPERFFGLDYAGLERAWLGWLEQEQGRDAAGATAWWATQRHFFNTVRAYETRYDPVARDLPDAPGGWSAVERQRYRANEDTPLNVALETQLIAASHALYCAHDVAASERLLVEVDAALAGAPLSEMLAARLALAERLARWQTALARDGGAALLPWPSAGAARALLDAAGLGQVRQETVRLQVDGSEAEAVVAWYTQGRPLAFRLRFEQAGARWRLAELAPYSVDALIPRSNRPCNR